MNPRLNGKDRFQCKIKDRMLNSRSNYGLPAWIQKSVFDVKLKVECEIYDCQIQGLKVRVNEKFRAEC